MSVLIRMVNKTLLQVLQYHYKMFEINLNSICNIKYIVLSCLIE